jgi:DNA-binding Lrp family transcriptional regulator
MSTLCAASIPHDKLDAVGSRIGRQQRVTHAYARVPYEFLQTPERTDLPNLWFTLSVREQAFEAEFDSIGHCVAPYPLCDLRSLGSYKIGVILDPESGTAAATGMRGPAPERPPAAPIDLGIEPDRSLIRILQESLPAGSTPFRELARRCDTDVEAVLARLEHWQHSGALRRIALVLRHRRAGFRANAMCVWNIASNAVDRVGSELGALDAVTHCYARRSCPQMPYTMYAMIHGQTWEQTRDVFSRMEFSLGLAGGRMLCSTYEYRKASPRYID